MSKFIFVYYHFLIFLLTNLFLAFIIIFVITNGDVAQLARANGSYPLGQRFESTHRYQNEQSTLNGRFIFLHNKNKCHILFSECDIYYFQN